MDEVLDSLIVDIYSGDLGGKPDIQALVDAGRPWCGLILKATQGLSFNGGDWLATYWPQARSLARDRYGVDWFRGTYHYIDVDEDGEAQADYFLARIENVGGWAAGDLWPIVDVEAAGQPADATASQVVDVVSAFAQRISNVLGFAPMLYGGSYLRGLGIADHMNCQLLWIPRWTATLPASSYLDLGWSLANTWAWQYCGDGSASLAGYPSKSPMGTTDISAVIIHGGGDPDADLAWTRRRLGT